MKKVPVLLLIAGFIVCLAGVAAAEGPHDMQCMDCHTTHYSKGSYAFGVQPKVEMNPARTRTSSDVDAIDALCLGCHNEETGIKPIKMHTSHPTSVRPIFAKVPPKLLWDGKLTCVSCHNPHPSNANHKYLVVPTSKGSSMGTFCAVCHPDQSSSETMKMAASVTIKSDPAQAPIVLVTGKASPKPAPAVKKPSTAPAKMP
ncbi:MAG: cytochrome C [Proteobacteria bacterium]|nr:cytochrome C [Pseudomonadota bacterium]MBU1594166.1 cytochrome C [Pseudomonadota bacterium]